MSLLLYHNVHNKLCKSPEAVSHEGLKVTFKRIFVSVEFFIKLFIPSMSTHVISPEQLNGP